MNVLRQIWVVTALNFGMLRHRAWQSAVIVVGMASVSGVLLSMSAMSEGFRQAHMNTGDPRAVIVLSRGTVMWENNSVIPRDQGRIILNAPGLAKMADGSSLADPGIDSGTPVTLKTGASAYAQLRTFGKMGAALNPGFHLLSGRMFQPGRHELIVGVTAAAKFKNTSIGDTVIFPDGRWPIVGIFAAGNLLDGALVGDTESVMQAMRQNTYNTIVARLAAADGFARFRGALLRNPLLNVEVMPLPEWNARTSGPTSDFLRVLIYGVSLILAIGALFGCFNTMYAAVESRRQEIATLNALGYGAVAVAASVILEAVALAVSGALIGAVIAWSLYDGVEGRFGWDYFHLIVSPAMIGIACLWALAVSLLGGLFPAIRTARMPVATALRPA